LPTIKIRLYPAPYQALTSTPAGGTYQPSTPSGSGSYTPSSGSSSGSYDGAGLEGMVGFIRGLNFGPSMTSSNGVNQYGIQTKFGYENFRVRTGLHIGSEASSINGALTYSLSDRPTMFNPFVGAGMGVKTLAKVGNSESSEFAFYGTGGVDLNISDNFVISSAVNLPTSSTYGTEFQEAIHFSTGF
jgi:hypothetical protein